MKTNQSILEYRREEARDYALKWALNPNPQFYDYTSLGGDCTNFASQALWAGGSLMNYDPQSGWYYIDPNRKSSSWTGVNFLYDFLMTNRSRGPFAALVQPQDLRIADLIQLSFHGDGKFNHTVVITGLEPPFTPEHIYITNHTPNTANSKLTKYYPWREIRYIQILGSRNVP
jgi:hypothetical protein